MMLTTYRSAKRLVPALATALLIAGCAGSDAPHRASTGNAPSLATEPSDESTAAAPDDFPTADGLVRLARSVEGVNAGDLSPSGPADLAARSVAAIEFEITSASERWTATEVEGTGHSVDDAWVALTLSPVRIQPSSYASPESLEMLIPVGTLTPWNRAELDAQIADVVKAAPSGVRGVFYVGSGHPTDEAYWSRTFFLGSNGQAATINPGVDEGAFSWDEVERAWGTVTSGSG